MGISKGSYLENNIRERDYKKGLKAKLKDKGVGEAGFTKPKMKARRPEFTEYISLII